MSISLCRNLFCALTPALSAITLLVPAVWAAPAAERSVLRFPTKPVRWIVPAPTGGGLDIVARVVGQKLSERWGYQIVVDNRPGAGNRLGAEIAAKATPDGYTQALLASPTLTTDRSVHSKLPYDPEKSFVPITIVASTSQLLVVNAALPPKTVLELIAYAKARPGQLNYGSTGVGGSLHLAMALFKSMAGIGIVHVPYKGGPLAVIDLLSGQLALMFFNTPAALPFVKSGKVRALGISTVRRSPLLPEVPTIAEAGVPGFHTDIWYGLVAPATTASVIIRKVHGDVVAVLSLPEVSKHLSALGADPVGNTPEEFARLIKAETEKWAQVIKAARIRAGD